MTEKKIEQRLRRKQRIRKRVTGSAERPRLVVFRSNKHIYAQVVEDRFGEGCLAVVAVGSRGGGLREELDGKRKADQARVIGAAIAKACLAKGIDKVVFDRNGYAYHGRVRALAEGAREGGLNF